MDTSKKRVLFFCLLLSWYQSIIIAELEDGKQQESKEQKREDKEEQIKKGLITLVLTAGACIAVNEAWEGRDNLAALRFGKESDACITPGELKFVIGLSGFCWALKNFGIEWAGEIAKKLPIAAISLKLVNWDAFQSLIQKIPIIGENIGCTTDQRYSVKEKELREDSDSPRGRSKLPKMEESQFALRRGLQTIFIYNMAERLLPIAYKKATQTVKNFFRTRPVITQQP